MVARDAIQHSQGLLEIRDRADLHRIIATDLARIDIDMDHFGRRNVEGVLDSHELQSASQKRVPSASSQSAARQLSLMYCVPQNPVMPSVSG